MTIEYDPYQEYKYLNGNENRDKYQDFLVGQVSQLRAFFLLEQEKIVLRVRTASDEEDHRSIDGWIDLNIRELSTLPLQVKSSSYYREKFLNSQRYQDLVREFGGAIVLNSGPQQKDSWILHSFHSQLRHIRMLVNLNR